jgi:hypothetical protein
MLAALGSILILTGSAVDLQAAAWPETKVQTAGEIRYVNGGFGIEEREAMPRGYPLKLMFATAKGQYLAHADVTILDASGKKVFQVKADEGPWLLVDLKAGRYTVQAVHNGHQRTASVDVPASGTVPVLLTWKTSEVDMGLPE